MPPTSGPVLSLSSSQSPTDFVPISIRASSGTTAAVIENSGVVENVNALPARVPSSNLCPTSTHGMVTRSRTGKECKDATLTTDVSDTGQAHSKSATAPTNTRVPNDDLRSVSTASIGGRRSQISTTSRRRWTWRSNEEESDLLQSKVINIDLLQWRSSMLITTISFDWRRPSNSRRKNHRQRNLRELILKSKLQSC
ncbi:hypothetical protein LWI29_003217 [Acer saccharum]|uniref:Uncharacterized protein n=1 Tax=Acer saccharum TaxID=4024 RepID=A0AA39RAT3_ACESA|nr:hypothetical protein LWI29_003217 [Acer saccharum]